MIGKRRRRRKEEEAVQPSLQLAPINANTTISRRSNVTIPPPSKPSYRHDDRLSASFMRHVMSESAVNPKPKPMLPSGLHPPQASTIGVLTPPSRHVCTFKGQC